MELDSQAGKSRIRAALYIDGFNLYHSVNDLGEPFLKWCNFWKLGESIISRQSEELVRVVFCTAYYPGDHSKKIRHERLVRALKLVGVETVLGHFSHEDAKCRDCGSTWQKPTEKATDINLALSVYDDAVQDVMDTAYLLTADTDQAATAKLFAKRFPGKKLVSVSPPGRTHSQHILSHTPHKIALNREHIERALFPGLVTAEGQASVMRPHEYDCQTAWNVGSSALSVLADLRAATLYGSTSGGMEDTLAQKIELRAAVHAPLDQLEPVDLSLDGAVAPGLDDGRAYGSLVLPEPGDEAAEIGRGCGLKPRRQSCRISLAEEIGEGPHILDGLPELRGSDAECVGEGTILRQQRRRIAGQPSGDAPCRGDSSGRRSDRRP
jgi:NYN domain